MNRLVLLKSFTDGYFRDGKWVKGYDNHKKKKPKDVHSSKAEKKMEAEGKVPIGFKDKGSGQSHFFDWFGVGKQVASTTMPSPPPKAKAYHPLPNDKGHEVPIWDPHEASDPEAWSDPDAIATVCPGGELPDSLYGVPFAPWTDHPQTIEGWDYVEGQLEDLDEPDMELPSGYQPAAGVLIQEDDGRVWVIHPTNRFAGYKATFPKGHTDNELSFQAAAIKECFEESGLKVEIEGLVGDVKRGQTVTRYYRARRVGGSPAAMGWESQAVSLVPAEEVPDLVNSHYDKKVATLAGFGKPHAVEVMDHWKQVGQQKGSNPGGFFEDDAGQRWYCKFPKTYGHARNEMLAAKLYEALGIRVPELKLVEDHGEIGLASKAVDGVKQDSAAIKSGKVPGVYEGFVADAWLANWDAVGLGYDNLLVGPDGAAIRIDVGGSLLYRAQGSPKGHAFGDKVGEINSLRDPKNHWPASVFGNMPESAIVAGVKRLATLPDSEIRGLVEAYGPGGKAGRARLADRLIARKNDLISRFLSPDG